MSQNISCATLKVKLKNILHILQGACEISYYNIMLRNVKFTSDMWFVASEVFIL